jgi:hypothetical protein
VENLKYTTDDVVTKVAATTDYDIESIQRYYIVGLALVNSIHES